MKNVKLQFMLATTLLGAVFSSYAQSWQVILPSIAGGSVPAGLGRDLLINPFTANSGDVFLAIEKYSANVASASIFRLKPADALSSTFTIDPMDGGLDGVDRLGRNPGDGLYASGYKTVVIPGSNKTQSETLMTWTVRRSNEADQGNLNTWRDDDSFQFSGTTTSKGKTTTTLYRSRAYGVTTDASGNVYVCGFAFDGSVFHWIIRKKSTAGWAKVLDIKAVDSYSLPYNICFVPGSGNNPAAALFVVGILNDRWTVLRSRDQGASWQSVGAWPDNTTEASAFDAASDTAGNLYVIGVRGRDGYNRGWVVRKSSDGGQNWETLLDQPSQLDSWAVRVAIDNANNITVAGAIDNASGTPRWTVVRNSPGQAWSDSWARRSFPLGESATSLSKGRGMVTDPTGNMFFTGDMIDWTDPSDGTFYSGTRVGLLRLTP